jgi:hypothetical protein
MGISVLSSVSNFDLHCFCGGKRREIGFRVDMCFPSEAGLRADFEARSGAQRKSLIRLRHDIEKQCVYYNSLSEAL